MSKKTVCFVVLMMVVATVAIFAQSRGSIMYIDNLDRDSFLRRVNQMYQRAEQRYGSKWIDKLPDLIINDIHQSIRNYSSSLRNNDFFVYTRIFQGFMYTVSLRITDAQTRSWSWLAWFEPDF